jgi:hypothetical protein
MIVQPENFNPCFSLIENMDHTYSLAVVYKDHIIENTPTQQEYKGDWSVDFKVKKDPTEIWGKKVIKLSLPTGFLTTNKKIIINTSTSSSSFHGSTYNPDFKGKVTIQFEDAFDEGFSTVE